MLNHLDLFSGIGGFALGLSWTGGFKTTGFCEIDPYCQQVLRKHWPDVPIYNDVKDFDHDGTVDILTGGYPCQGESLAGLQKGAGDDRWLWPEMFSCVQKYRPSWVIGENVAGHVTMGLDTVLSDLESEAYTCQAFIIPACAAGAHHRRDRVWVVAHAQSLCGRPRLCGDHAGQEHKPTDGSGVVSNANGAGFKKQWWPVTGAEKHPAIERCGRRAVEPRMGRVADGVPHRVDRLKGLGNAVDPHIPYILGLAILEAHYENRVISTRARQRQQADP